MSTGRFGGCHTSVPREFRHTICTWQAISFKCLILITVIVLSILFYRPFCKWLCPLGAIYSLFNKISFLNIKVENSKCVGCGLCSGACKMDVDVRKTPNHPECIRCGACMKACPKDAIHYQFMEKTCSSNLNNQQ